MRSLPPGTVCASPQEYTVGPARFRILHVWEMRTGFFFVCTSHFGNNQEGPCSSMNIQYMFMQMWFHETARMTEYIKKISYQSVIKCNACALDEICMTNWLWRTQSRQVLWTFCTKAHWNSFHYDCGEETEWEGQAGREREREEDNDSDYRGRKSLASRTGISLARRKTHERETWAFSYFIYKCYSLPFSVIYSSQTC